jgi:nucleoside-diphosphate-sugar epimerase
MTGEMVASYRVWRGAVPILLHRLRTGQPVTIWDDRIVVHDYLYVSDLVEMGPDAGRG